MSAIEERRASQKERRILRTMSTCKNFTGIQHECCTAGLNYHQQFGSGEGCFANIPCTHEPGENTKLCPSVEYPSREEAEAAYAEAERRNKLALQAMRDAHADAKAKGYGVGNGGADSLKCPLCTDGTLQYRVASINGHMHARCTNGCVSWME